MDQVVNLRMTSDEFIEWSMRQPEGRRVELLDRQVLEMASERWPTRSVDTSFKLGGYFSLPSMRHYLIVCTEPQTIIHHERHEDGAIIVTLLTSGSLQLDPLGITLDIASLFPPGAD